MRGYHSTSNWLGEPTRERIAPDPDEAWERMRDEIEAQNEIDAAARHGQMRIAFEQKEGVA